MSVEYEDVKLFKLLAVPRDFAVRHTLSGMNAPHLFQEEA